MRTPLAAVIIASALTLTACGSGSPSSSPSPAAPSSAPTSAAPSAAAKGASVSFGSFDGRESETLRRSGAALEVLEFHVSKPVTVTGWAPATTSGHYRLGALTFARVLNAVNGGGDFAALVPPTSVPGTTGNPRKDLNWAARKPVVGAKLARGSYYLFMPITVKGSAVLDDWTLRWTNADGSTGQANQNVRFTYKVRA